MQTQGTMDHWWSPMLGPSAEGLNLQMLKACRERLFRQPNSVNHISLFPLVVSGYETIREILLQQYSSI